MVLIHMSNNVFNYQRHYLRESADFSLAQSQLLTIHAIGNLTSGWKISGLSGRLLFVPDLLCCPTDICLICDWPLCELCFIHHCWQQTHFSHKISNLTAPYCTVVSQAKIQLTYSISIIKLSRRFPRMNFPFLFSLAKKVSIFIMQELYLTFIILEFFF